MLVSFVSLTGIYLGSPLPAPKVELRVLSLVSSTGTNAIASLSFTNHGQTSVVFSEAVGRIIVETRAGWTTNQAPSTEPLVRDIEPGKHRTFSVPIPFDSIRFQVKSTYYFQRWRNNPGSDANALLHRVGFWSSAPKFAVDAANSCIYHLMREPGENEIATAWITNLFPAQVKAPD